VFTVCRDQYSLHIHPITYPKVMDGRKLSSCICEGGGDHVGTVLMVRHALHCLRAEQEPATRSYWAIGSRSSMPISNISFTHSAFVAISRVRATHHCAPPKPTMQVHYHYASLCTMICSADHFPPLPYLLPPSPQSLEASQTRTLNMGTLEIKEGV